MTSYLPSTSAILGEYLPRSFERSVEVRMRVIFSHYGPKLGRVDKDFLWLLLSSLFAMLLPAICQPELTSLIMLVGVSRKCPLLALHIK